MSEIVHRIQDFLLACWITIVLLFMIVSTLVATLIPFVAVIAGFALISWFIKWLITGSW